MLSDAKYALLAVCMFGGAHMLLVIGYDTGTFPRLFLLECVDCFFFSSATFCHENYQKS